MHDVSQCANQNCAAAFDRLSDGKLFTCPRDAFNFVWLCEHCMRRFTVEWHQLEPIVTAVAPSRRLRAG
jgi:hypothetical protein